MSRRHYRRSPPQKMGYLHVCAYSQDLWKAIHSKWHFRHLQSLLICAMAHNISEASQFNRFATSPPLSFWPYSSTAVAGIRDWGRVGSADYACRNQSFSSKHLDLWRRTSVLGQYQQRLHSQESLGGASRQVILEFWIRVIHLFCPHCGTMIGGLADPKLVDKTTAHACECSRQARNN